MSSARHAVLDVVEFLTASGRWPAGTVGTVVETDDQRVLVELADGHGHAVDFVSMPHDKLAPAGDTSRAAS